VLREAVHAPLAELGVIAASGDDAARFLHGQLTNDVEHLAADRLALAGYCTAKGRLLSTFRLWRDERGVCLLLPRELLPGVLKRLSMFVLRAKAKLVDDSLPGMSRRCSAGRPRRSCARSALRYRRHRAIASGTVQRASPAARLAARAERFLVLRRRRSRAGRLTACELHTVGSGASGGARSTPACRRYSPPRRRSSCRR